MYLLGYTCQHKNRVARVGRAEGVEEEEVIERRRKKKKRLTKICADTKVSILSGKRTRLEYTFFLAEILAQRNIEGTLRVSAHYLVQIRLILIDGLFHVISSLAFLVNE